MKRVLIVGCPGAGKSTFARKLQKRTGLPLHYLDRLWWKPDRTVVSREEFDEALALLLEEGRWIIDGNFLRTMEPRIRACDTVIFLDYPQELCLNSAEARIGTARPDLPWVETEMDPEFRDWILNFEREQKPEILRLLQNYSEGREIHIFRSREEGNSWLKEETMFTVRKTTKEDLPVVLEMYRTAREFMKANGNPSQWGDGRPSDAAIIKDIETGTSYSVVSVDSEGRETIEAEFSLWTGEDPDPNYARIDGAWLAPGPYGVIHKVATGGRRNGAAKFAMEWCETQIDNLRIDTHADNIPMQKLIEKMGYTYCGIVTVDDGTLRYAYQKLLRK